MNKKPQHLSPEQEAQIVEMAVRFYARLPKQHLTDQNFPGAKAQMAMAVDHAEQFFYTLRARGYVGGEK